SLRPARRIRLSAPPDGFDLSGDNRAAIASRQDRRIAIASLTGAAIERTIAAGAEPSIVRFQSDGKQLLAGSRPDRNVTIFDVATGKTVVRLPLPLEPRPGRHGNHRHVALLPPGGESGHQPRYGLRCRFAQAGGGGPGGPATGLDP